MKNVTVVGSEMLEPEIDGDGTAYVQGSVTIRLEQRVAITKSIADRLSSDELKTQAAEVITNLDNIAFWIGAPSAPEKATIEAETVQTIVDAPAVDTALRSFYEDATNDNAFFLVRSIMEACLPSSSAPQVEPEPEPAPEGYFAYSDDAGYEEFETAEEAKDRALAEIDLYREDAFDGWPDEIDSVCWGIIVQRAKGFDQQDIPTDDPNHTYQTCDYRLEPVIPAGGDDA
ncbi:TPA: hypothetical protein SMF87_004525 [Serratia marcescens]|nr:hypothetical protein [Serratia marcescens]